MGAACNLAWLGSPNSYIFGTWKVYGSFSGQFMAMILEELQLLTEDRDRKVSYAINIIFLW